jgi:cephalosporin hydroxylase
MTTSDFFNYIPFYRYAASIKHFTQFVEVGSYAGASCAFLANDLKSQGRQFKVFAVDLWDKPGAPEDRWIFPFSEFMEKLAHMQLVDVIQPVQEESDKAAAFFQDLSVDFVFIDANHSYEHVIADIKAWMPKVKHGGLLSGHDYGEPCEVKRAVDEMLGGKISLMGTCWYTFIK